MIGHNSPTRTAPLISVTTLDKVALSRLGRDVAVRNRKSRAVLAYLALSPHGFETRERICGLLWSESDEARARASLRQTVVDLKACLAEIEGVFSGDRLNVTLKPSLVTVDVGEIRHELKAGRIPPSFWRGSVSPKAFSMAWTTSTLRFGTGSLSSGNAFRTNLSHVWKRWPRPRQTGQP